MRPYVELVTFTHTGGSDITACCRLHPQR